MSVQQALAIEAQVSVGEPVRIPFDFTDQSSVPEGKTPGTSIVLRPITVRTWFRLKPLLAKIEQEDLDALCANEGDKFDGKKAQIIIKYSDILFEILCIGIHNRQGDMPQWFRKVLMDNCTWGDVYVLLNGILFRVMAQPFINSITLAKSVSPLGEEEIIALRKNKTSWNQPVRLPSSRYAMRHSD